LTTKRDIKPVVGVACIVRVYLVGLDAAATALSTVAMARTDNGDAEDHADASHRPATAQTTA
jgi:hypothetical protein